MNSCIDFLEENLTPHCDDKLKMYLKKMCEHAREIHQIEIRKAFNAARERPEVIYNQYADDFLRETYDYEK